MSRSSRRRNRSVAVPEDVVRHSGLVFDDALDSPDLQEGISLPTGVPLLSDSQFSLPAAPWRLPSIELGYGAEPHAKPVHRLSVARVRAWERARIRRLVHAKRVSADLAEFRRARERRRLLFNVLSVPFSKRARFCVKRKIRRQVIFAKKFSGRNGGKAYRRTYESAYKC